MKLTNVNIPLDDINDSGHATSRVLFAMKNLMVAAGWKVLGSGDGISRWACEGHTAALPPEQQGDGGAYDCWLTPEVYATVGNPHAGSCWASRAWVCLQEPPGGHDRQWIFQQSSAQPTQNSYGGYINVGAHHSGGVDLSAANLNTVPAISDSGGRWVYGSANGQGQNLFSSSYILSSAHLFAYDDPQNEAFAWGWLVMNSTGTPRSMHALATLAPDSPHLDADNDRVVMILSTGNNAVPDGSLTWRWRQYGTPSQTWQSCAWELQNYWRGLGPVDPRDGLDRVAMPQVYQAGGTSAEQYVGALDRGMRLSGRPLAYPLLARDQHGQNWVWIGAGVLWPWDDDPDPPAPA